MAGEILIIENAGFIAGLLGKTLIKKGYGISALEYDTGLQRARKQKAALVLLDAPTSAAEAVELCRVLRDTTPAPIIALTEGLTELEPIDGVQYMAKPVVVRELLKAVGDALSRQPSPRKLPVHVLRYGGLALDVKTHALTKGKRRYRLTPKEFLLLQVFMKTPGKVLSHKTLLKKVWKTAYLDDLRTLYVHVSWLRKKIEDDPQRPVCLRTVRGVGYRFEAKP